VEALYVALGGAAGCLARYGVVHAAHKWRPDVPVGTLVVNLVGAVVIGLALPFLAARGASWVRPLLVMGFLGGFTTMSSFAGDVVQLMRDGRYLTALGVWAAGALACPLAAALAWKASES